VAFDGHRSNDDAPHAYVSEDFGATWRSLNGTLPAVGSTRALREDIHEENLIYAGTEFGVFASLDRGRTWAKINGNVPTNSVQEVAIHPTAGEIAIATHGRGVWILDVTHLRQMTNAAVHGTHLFSPAPAILWGPRGIRQGDLYGHDRFYGENHPNGAVIYYGLQDGVDEVALRIEDTEGNVVRVLPDSILGEGASEPGLHRLIWDFRRDLTEEEQAQADSARAAAEEAGRPFRQPSLPRVDQGTYQVVLTVEGEAFSRRLHILPDPGNR
jgi:hypothetical protein